MKYNKLVRDNIPEIIKANGEASMIHIAGETEYKEKLIEKLQEEVDEFIKDNSKEELADILEVIYALGDLYEIKKEELEKVCQN